MDTYSLTYTEGAFFWEYSRIGLLGIDSICVLLGAIPFSELTEYHSVDSAPDSRMNRMEGMQLTLACVAGVRKGRGRRRAD